MSDPERDIPAASEQSRFVHIGRDGWLFLRGGSNHVETLYSRESGELSDARLAKWRKLIETRTARCRRLGITCLHVVVPEKVTIYGDLQGEAFVDPDLSPAVRLSEQLSRSRAADAYVDLVAPLREGRRTRPVYWREDTHWTAEGCDVAYRAICSRLGARPEDDLLARRRLEQKRIMDLGGRLVPPRWEKVQFYDFSQKSWRVWINNVTRYLEDPAYMEEFHVGARARFANDVANDPRSVLLFGDSYSRPDYRMLTGMLAETFRSLDFVWSGRIDWSYLRKCAPDIVIFEIAERFLATFPRDMARLPLIELRVELRARRRRIERRRAQSAKTD